jgi:KAP-like P-loop domain-containing protein
LKDVNGIFVDLRYIDMRKPDRAAYDLLVEALRPNRRIGQLDDLIDSLVDGDEERRSAVLEQVVDGTISDKFGFAERLRKELQGRFSAQAKDSFASSIRDPNRMPSIRSWMLSVLIWADAESALSRELILQHLNAAYEPARNVRFWTLAGLCQRGVNYIQRGVDLCLSDSMPEVSLLAQALSANAVTDPDGAGTLAHFQSMLYSQDFEREAWPALRVLRILPILPLAKDLSNVLDRSAGDSPLAYDTLYALANAKMAEAAVPFLLETYGIDRLLDIILEVLRNSDRGAARRFANLLAAFEPIAVEQALTRAESRDARVAAAADRLRRDILEHRVQPSEVPQTFVAGYASDDIDVTRDDLGIREDVQTLTAVMLAREVVPPLAIGLFGDWGAGKSYFMRSMKAAAKQISDDARTRNSNKFCTEIVSIEFNAWHYADTNLWASLVSHILESLARHVSPSETPEQQQARLVQALGSAKEIISQIEGERQTTKEQIVRRQADLQQLQIARERKEIELQDLRMTDLRRVLSADPDLQRELKGALEEMGMPAVLSSLSDLNETVAEVNSLRGRITGLAIGLFKAPKGVWLWLAAILILALPFLAHWAHQYLQNSFIFLGTIVGELATVAAASAALLRKAAGYVRDKLEQVEAAKRRVDDAMAERRKTPTSAEVELQEQIAALKGHEDQAVSRLRAATDKVIDLEQRIAALNDSRSLARFLTERTKSDDYRKHLGVISTIRHDFETLTQQLANPISVSGPTLPRVERIVLYVDDLDRCPANKVVEVLEAVHLLLAYPLFVVVVGVDPRWLAYSLTSVYPVLQLSSHADSDPAEHGDGRDHWRPTPQNYLEKIFQIPFSLRPMTRNGFGRLVDGLLSPTEVKPTPSPQPSAGPPPAPPLPVNPNVPPPPVDPNDNPPIPPAPPLDPVRPRNDYAGKPEFTIHEEAMVIRPPETAFAQRLFGMLPTPRATKRFSNTYRLLKASVPLGELRTFEGSEQAPGTFQAPMFFLAILIGMPSEAVAFFPALYDRLKELGGSKELQASEILEFASPALRARIIDIVSRDTFPRSAALLEDHLRRVSRFSFDIGRTVESAALSKR